MFFKKILLTLGLFTLGVDFACATLNDSIDTIVNSQSSNMQIGIYVKDLTSGTVLYSQDGTRPMTPASNTKVFTAAAAYLYLGPNYQYVTEIDSMAPVAANMKGNVYVYFSGDPTLTSKNVYALVAELKSKGVHQITGNVLIDDTVFSGPYYGLGWPQNDLSRCYAAPIGGAIINSNCMALHIVKSRGAPKPNVKQFTTQFPIVDQLRLGGTNSRMRNCMFQPFISGKNNIVLQGCLPSHAQWSGAVAIKNPNDYAVQVVKAAFKRAGIQVTGKFESGVTPSSAVTLAQHSSKKLQIILSYMLKRSDNVYAGAVGKTLGNEYFGVGSYKSAANAINSILIGHIGDTFKPVYLDDTAGMSSYNLIAPQQLVDVLGYMYNQADISNIFMQSLAISGQRGTLAYRLNKWPLLGHVFGKTGTLNGVSTLSGYLAVPGHSVIAFAIMMNDINGSAYYARRMQDKIVQAIAANT